MPMKGSQTTPVPNTDSQDLGRTVMISSIVLHQETTRLVSTNTSMVVNRNQDSSNFHQTTSKAMALQQDAKVQGCSTLV